MSNYLRKMEKELRSYAKRVKGVSYTSGLLITFLLTGVLSLLNVILDKEISKSNDRFKIIRNIEKNIKNIEKK